MVNLPFSSYCFLVPHCACLSLFPGATVCVLSFNVCFVHVCLCVVYVCVFARCVCVFAHMRRLYISLDMTNISTILGPWHGEGNGVVFYGE